MLGPQGGVGVSGTNAGARARHPRPNEMARPPLGNQGLGNLCLHFSIPVR